MGSERVTELKHSVELQEETIPAAGGGTSPARDALEACRDWMLPMLIGGAMKLGYEDAEDVVHDAILASLETDGILNLPAWLAGTAFLGAITLLRKRWRQANHEQRIALFGAGVQRARLRGEVDPFV